MSTSEVSSDVDEPNDRHHQRSDSLNGADDCEDNDNLSLSQRRIIKQVPLNRFSRMSIMESGTSLQYESPPSCKQQHKPPQSQRVSSPLNVESVTAEVEAEKSKKLLEWELSSLEADDLRSHAWYHGYQVNRTEAERLLRQCVAEEYGSATNFIITANDTVSVSPPSDVSATATNCSSSLQQHVDEASDSDLSSNSSDEDLGITDFMDERGLVVNLSKTKSTEMGGALLKRRLGPHRPRRHFYCFLVRYSLNVGPTGRYVLSCLRVDKYEDNETWDKNKSQIYHDVQRRKNRRQQQRRQQRQLRHPVLHFVVNEIIQPGTVYERSQFSIGETLPSMTTDISTTAVNNNGQHQPGFDSVPDLIRYYVGGADDNAVLLYGGENFGAVGTSCRTSSRIAQVEVRLRYPCNRRCPLMTDYSLVEAAFPNILLSTDENSRLIRQRCRTLTAASVCTEGLQVLSTSSSKEKEASTSSQNNNHRHHSPSPPPQTSKSSLSRSSIRRIPSATVNSEMVASATSLKPSTARGSAQNQSQPLTKSPCPPRIDSQSSITESTSVSPNSSVKTLPRQPKSSYPLPSTLRSLSTSDQSIVLEFLSDFCDRNEEGSFYDKWEPKISEFNPILYDELTSPKVNLGGSLYFYDSLNFSGNKNDNIDKKGEQSSSSLTDHQKQIQQDGDQFADEMLKMLEDQMKNDEVRQKSVEEEHTIDDTKVKENDKQRSSKNKK